MYTTLTSSERFRQVDVVCILMNDLCVVTGELSVRIPCHSENKF